MNIWNKKIISEGRWMTALFMMVAFFSPPSLAVIIPQDDPEEMVRVLSQELIAKINEQRAELEAHPEKMKAFADAYVLPYVDTEKMARYVMGRYWRTATDEQKEAFTQAFSDMLIHSYSKNLLKLQINKVVVKPAREVKKGVVTVASVVTQTGGNQTDVVYRVYQNRKAPKWLLYDISIEGISMLLNYRKSYGSEISKKGLDQVITEMVAKNSFTPTQA
ncbi:Phospholipid ABC transporter shuttle protein MlaC [hydrothermal vent metagenome]|uniref:Phospholipid ABC transporter shuttle protein MlaC n=1 Tax=hydrothermal vent metagenome TaxID=652676 RepID=A0A3B0W256_9ZZZZ